MPIETGLQLEDECRLIETGPGELCVPFPGGATLCAQVGYDIGDPSTIVKSMLAQLNTAMVPLTPFFDVLDFVKAVSDCIHAIPDSLGPPPSPQPIIDCLGGLAKAVSKLLAMIPPFPIFAMVKGILTVITTGLQGLKLKIQALLNHQLRITAAATIAAQTGNVGLTAVVDCASGNIDAQWHNLNAELAPLNRLIGAINVFLKLAGSDCIPAIGGVASDSSALGALQAIIDLLQAVNAVIPGGLPNLTPITPNECL